MSEQTFNNMKSTYDKLKLKQTTLHYLSTEASTNLTRLSEVLKAADPQESGLLPLSRFKECLMQANMNMGERTLQVLQEELSSIEGVPKMEEGMVPYQLFMDTMYVTSMFINELDLYNAMQAADVEGHNGVTITEVQEILKSNPKLNFPEEALGAAFKTLLGADIKSIDPNCIIDTEKFIASLHKEFEGVVARSVSKLSSN